MEERAVVIDSVRSVGPDGIGVVLTTPEGFDAMPGQFVKLSATVEGESVSRMYTISSPDVDETFELTVGVDPVGTLSPWLADADPGTTVRVSGPYGAAHYEGERRVVVVAGGPGVGPAVAIAERAVDDGGEAAVVYRDSEPLHTDRLDRLDANRATVSVLESEAELATVVADHLTDDVSEQLFIYGFETFVAEARDAVESAGREPATAKIENFG
jgi:3-phenylpropionate/trans-cinnamate dioxygenase ferredoxin reductase subunit